MISKRTIEDVITWQLATVDPSSFERQMLKDIHLDHRQFAYIITGIRRCGKSTLIQQIMRSHADEAIYLNFDTPNMYGFRMEDFRILDVIIDEKKAKWLFFDEIQVVQGWEIYIRSKLEQGYHVVITGSNSTMLSRELGTRLTGRHLSYTLYPFSFQEYLGYTNQTASEETLDRYLACGGMPEYVQTQDPLILTNLISDILYRDILVRYNLHDESAMKNLFVYLMGNIGNLTSANRLTSAINVKSAATVTSYFSYLEDSFMVKFLPKFSYSYKSQLLNPKKIYSIDLGLHNVSTPSFSQDRGHKLENIVYLELLRSNHTLFYFNENQHECDFVLFHNNTPVSAIQVCEKIHHDNEGREVGGLNEAMKALGIKKGMLLTTSQEDLLYDGDREIKIIPAWKWLTSLP